MKSIRVDRTFPIRLPFAILLAMLIIPLLTGCGSQSMSGPLFSFGVVTDVQYADAETAGSRFYRNSTVKLEECVAELNKNELEFVIHLGDLIDRGYASIDTILPIFRRLDAPQYFVLGNHDFAYEKKQIPQMLSRFGLEMPGSAEGYYDFGLQGCRFIVLNGNDVSIYANPESSPKFAEAESLISGLKENNAPNAYDWNGGIGGEQMEWLHATLDDARKKEERVILFCHFPVYPPNAHNLLNDAALLGVIDEYDNIVVYMNGHNHAGDYGERNGVFYITFQGMVETENETAYSVVEVFPGMLNIRGYGREPNRSLKF